MSIYDNRQIVQILIKTVERSTEEVKSGTRQLDDILGELSEFVKMIGYSEKNDDLILVRVLINTMAGMYGTQRMRQESRRRGKSEQELKEIDARLTEFKEKGKKIISQTLTNLKESLGGKDPKNKVLESLQMGLVQLDKEIIEPYP